MARRKTRRDFFQTLALGRQPRFSIFTDPSFAESGLFTSNPFGQGLQNNASLIQNLLAPAPAVTFRGNLLPSVQTSPGVFESPFVLAGVPDPRQAKWDAMVGREPRPQVLSAEQVQLAEQILG